MMNIKIVKCYVECAEKSKKKYKNLSIYSENDAKQTWKITPLFF